MIDDGLFMHHPTRNDVFISAALADCCLADAHCPTDYISVSSHFVIVRVNSVM